MNDVKTPAYFVVQLEIKNQDEYIQRYGMPVLAMFESIGAEVLALSPAPTVLEGEWSGNWTVVIRFPSKNVAEQWYNSTEYQPLKALRMSELTEGGSVVLVEGFDPTALGI